MLLSTGPILGQIKITKKQMQDADDWEQKWKPRVWMEHR
jgi:hypothetical protein